MTYINPEVFFEYLTVTFGHLEGPPIHEKGYQAGNQSTSLNFSTIDSRMSRLTYMLYYDTFLETKENPFSPFTLNSIPLM